MEAVGDVLDGLSQVERAELIEAVNHGPLTLSVQFLDWSSELTLDLVDEAIECVMEPGEAETADRQSVDIDREITRLQFVVRDDDNTNGARHRDEPVEDRTVLVNWFAHLATLAPYPRASPGSEYRYLIPMTDDCLRPSTMRIRSEQPTSSARPTPLRAVGLLVAVMMVLSGLDAAGGQESVADARSERDQVRRERADAAAELNAARADDAEVQAALDAINESVLAQQNSLVDAQRQLDVARAVAEQATADVAAAQARIAEIRTELAAIAVSGFVGEGRASNGSYDYLSAESPADAMRHSTMLQLANSDAPDLLEQMRVVQEDADIAQAIADNAVEQSAVIEAEMANLLIELEAQQAVQAELKAEMAARVADWEQTVAEFEAEEAELSEFIRAEEAKAIPPPPPPSSAATGTSAAGFQWPISAYVTSEYGWRIHPIYGTKRLHAGIDLGAGTGTPIAAAAGGTVISAGWLGGYGNSVIINHGNGVTTLYAHQSKISVSNGQQVGQGEVIGLVGSTGNSTGPHLHLEFRVNGSAVNPRGYLP